MRISLLLLSLVFSLSLPAQPKTLITKARVLRVFLDKKHYAPLVWNDSSSERLYNRWISLLDDDKAFFTQADMGLLDQFKRKLDDELNGQEWLFFDKSIQVYRNAVKRADSLQQLVLDKPLDFSKPDSLHYPFSTYAGSVAELQQRLQKIARWRILRSIAVQIDSSGNSNDTVVKLPADFAARETRARQRLKRQHSIDIKMMLPMDGSFEKEMADRYLQAIAWCYDPHTTYMNLEDKKGFETELSGFEYSTGMNLAKDEEGNYKVDRLEPGGSAWRTGELHAGDVVLSIKKGSTEEKELAEMEEEEVQELLQGSSDETVVLTVKTAAGTTKKTTLTKEKVTDDEGIVKSYVIQGPQKIGYIKLPGFYSRESQEIESEADIKFDGCANDVSKEIVKLLRDTIAGLILDLRFNGGGSMWEAMQLAGIFIDYGPVAAVKDRQAAVQFLKDPNRGTVYDGPLLVLINGASASASELTSAVLQDYNRAVIAGSTTYGKGTAQSILPMDTAYEEESKKNYDDFNDFVKVTEQKFYRIDGSTTQWKGVSPDIELPDMYEGLGAGESAKPSALLPDNAKKGIYRPLPPLPIAQLKNSSNKRTVADSGFARIKRIAAWIKTMEQGRKIPLQWNTYIPEYRKNMEMYQALQQLERDGVQNIVSVNNNNFDKEKIKFASPSGKQLNDTYLRQIAADHYVIEAFNILHDWIRK